MTQTAYTPDGRSALWIEADHGHFKTGTRRIEWHKISLPDYLDQIDLEGLDAEQVRWITANLRLFDRGYAWQAWDDNFESVIVRTEREARDWAYSQNC